MPNYSEQWRKIEGRIESESAPVTATGVRFIHTTASYRYLGCSCGYVTHHVAVGWHEPANGDVVLGLTISPPLRLAERLRAAWRILRGGRAGHDLSEIYIAHADVPALHDAIDEAVTAGKREMASWTGTIATGGTAP